MFLMNSGFKFVIAMTLAFLITSETQAQYRKPANFDNLPTRNFVPKAGDDTSRLQSLINSLNSGGVITLASGNYQMDGVRLRNNIHIRFKKNVTITQSASNSVRARGVFELGRTGRITNASVVGPGSRAKINVKPGNATVRLGTNFRAISLADVKNFLVQNLTIREDGTRFCVINSSDKAIDGTLQNITMNGPGAEIGWGLYQPQGGINIVVRNLDGKGGTTLRLEQGDENQRIRNMRASVIKSRAGRSCILVGPKNRKSGGQGNGRVTISNCTAIGSGWAVTSGAGKSGGKFERVQITTVTARYASSGAQYRTPSGKFLPNNLRSLVKRDVTTKDPSRFSTGPSLGCISNKTGNAFPVVFKGQLRRLNFPFSDPAIVTAAYFDRVSANGR